MNDAPPDDNPPASGPEAPVPRRPAWRRTLARAAVAVLAPAAAIGWLAATESGLRLAAHLAGFLSAGMLEIGGPSGSLLNAPRLGRLHFRNADTDLALYDLAIDWSPSALLSGRLDIARLQIGRVEVGTLPSDKPRKLPASLQLPLALRIADAQVGRLTVTPLDRDHKPTGSKPFVVTDGRAALDSDGHLHHLRGASATLPFGELKAVGQIAGSAPYKLSAQIDLATAQFGGAYQVHADAGGSLAELSIALRAQGSDFAGSGVVVATPFSPVPFRSARLAVKGLDPSRFHASAPQALLDLDAELLPQLPAGLPPGRSVPVEQWVVAGPLHLSNRKPGQYDQQALPLQSLAMQLRWAAGELAASGVDLRLPGEGRITGAASWRPGLTTADHFGKLDADLRVAGVDAQRLDKRLPSSRIAGSLRAQGTLSDQTLVADLADPRFALRLTGRHAAGLLTLPRGELRAGKAQASVSGQMRLDAGRGFEAKAVLTHFDPRAFFSSLPSADINSRFNLRGQLAPQLAASFDVRLDPSRLEGHPLSGGGQLALAGKTVSRAELAFEVAGNRVSANGRYGRPGDVLKLVADAPALDALGHGFAGRARFNASLHGTPAEPAGEFSLVAGDLALPGGLRIGAANGQGSLAEGGNGHVELALAVTGVRTGTATRALVKSGQVTVSGTRGSHVAQVAAEFADASRLSANLAGGLAAGPGWQGRINRLALTGGDWPASLVAPVDLRMAPGMLVLGPAELRGREAVARLDETVFDHGNLSARGKLSGLRLGVEVNEQTRRPSLGGDSLSVGAEWDVRIRDTVDGLVRVFRESGDLVMAGDMPIALGLTQMEVVLNANANRLALGFSAAGRQLGQISGSATALAEHGPGGARLAPDAPLLGSARLDMPSIAWAGPLIDQNLSTGGRLKGEFTLSGTPANPVSEGRIRGDALSFAMADQGLALTGGTLVADFNRERVRIGEFNFVSPNRVRPAERRIDVAGLTSRPGRLTSNGEIRLADGVGRFSFHAERLPLLQRTDRWLLVSGDGEARSGENALSLTGHLTADAGYVTVARSMPPSLSEDVIVRGTGREAAQKQAGKGPLKLTTDITIGLGDAVYVDALGLDTRLDGEVRLRSSEGSPVRATGTIHTVGGVYEAYGQKLAITRGIVNFAGPVNNPGLNVVALRQGLEVEAGVAITGTARRPTVRLVSEPNVPDPEKLGWIVLGRPPDQGSGAELALLVPAAQALLGGSSGGRGGITDSMARSLGLDELSLGASSSVSGRQATSSVVGSSITGASAASSSYSQAGTVSGQVLTLGKRLSSDALLSFEQSISGAASLVKLTYQLTRRISLIARAGSDNALDLNFTLSFR